MNVWYNQACKNGQLCQEAKDGFRRLVREAKEDIFITSIDSGFHLPHSFHYSGRAIDIRPLKMSKEDMEKALGDGWQVVKHVDHDHLELDIDQ